MHDERAWPRKIVTELLSAPAWVVTELLSTPSRATMDRLRASLAPTLGLLFVLAPLCGRRGLTRRAALGTLSAGLVGAIGLGTTAAGGTDGDGDDGHRDRYVVGLEAGTSTERICRLASTLHRSRECSWGGSVVVGEFGDETRREFTDRPEVRYIEKDHVRRQSIHRSVEQSDSVDLADEQETPWGVERIGATDLHSAGADGSSVTVAILDSGVDPDHESLEVPEGKAFADCNGGSCATDWDDETGHGTHCAGTVGALDNGKGVVGVTPDVTLCALKVLAGDGSGYDSDIAAAIEWCADNDVDVINLSLGGSDEAQVLEDALEYAYERGVLIVAAAGNDGSTGGIDYPAAYDECIAVGATDERDGVPSWSARGDGIELVAPGENVLSTKPDDEYVYLDGTSMSTPHVAAIGAQLMSQGLEHADATDDIDDPGGVRGLLRETAEDLGFDEDEQGYGLLNSFEALEELEPITTEDVTAVRAQRATLNGSVRSIEDASTVDVSFEWRESDVSEWTETETESVEPDAEFDVELDELTPETEYDVRAVLDDGDETSTANVVTFETGLDELAVETGDLEAIDHRTIRGVGTLRGLGDAEDVAASFRIREEGDEEWKSSDSQSLEAIGTYEAELSGLEPETAYDVEAVAEGDDDRTTGETVTVDTEAEPGIPEIDRFELTDDSNGQFVRCNVHWRVSDRDGDLELVATELRYAGEDEELHRVASEIDGGEGSGVHTVRNSDRFEGAGKEYEITLTVTDAEGNVTEEREELSLDERSPAPSIDRFEVSSDDFLGTPEAVVDWAVSDDGEELDGVELELVRADDGEVVDDSSSMGRGEEASDTDSLRDGEFDGGEADYDVTIRATDYFEQTSEETTRITLGE
ncbi:S8 family peptidase [Natrarchaeobaculum sulfurireducens]|uniref:Serine alkaline protease (Subtilisin E) n=1 Tax=Natrarchaeobaculum sulfurireducens TaxID=2044521 RepID=A0A346PSR6_9EURY|nr:S8 family peptidase [Natrarchaeobaculum sulfurireducens]AXR82561.1 serine alkaline protease (subtilisin E) [Natrarchaeobaculum sulfurireducens]